MAIMYLSNENYTYPKEQIMQWFRRCCLEDFLSTALAALMFDIAVIYAILVEGIMVNIHVELFKFRPVVQWLFIEKVYA